MKPFWTYWLPMRFGFHVCTVHTRTVRRLRVNEDGWHRKGKGDSEWERESRDRTQFLLIIGSVCHWDGKTYLFLLCANMFVFCFVTCSLDENTELIRLITYLFFGRLVCCLIVKICKLCEMKHATCITPLPKWCKRIGKKSQF